MKPPPRPARKPTALAFADDYPDVGHRILLYGPGGVGKTTLADAAPGPIASFDFDRSLPILRLENTRALAGAGDWDDLRRILGGGGWDTIKTIVIDSGTKAESLALAWTLKNIPHEKGFRIRRLEDYGWGKGYQHVYEIWLKLLADLDAHALAGRNVILICHVCVADAPNPEGDNWDRYEPRLQLLKSGKADIRHATFEWADEVFFLGYDIDVKQRKGTGSGTRTIWPTELPHCMAKSRGTISAPVPISKGDADFWNFLTRKEADATT